MVQLMARIRTRCLPQWAPTDRETGPRGERGSKNAMKRERVGEAKLGVLWYTSVRIKGLAVSPDAHGNVSLNAG